MRLSRRLAACAFAAAAVIGFGPRAEAQDKKFKIGVIYDYSGPLAWLRHKGRRLAISLRLFLRQSAALGAERRRVPHPPDLYRP